jgi:hypothetical protein
LASITPKIISRHSQQFNAGNYGGLTAESAAEAERTMNASVDATMA